MQICPICYDDMKMVSSKEQLKFVCGSCGYEDNSWIKSKEDDNND